MNCGFICWWCLPAINPPVPFLRASCYPSGSSKKSSGKEHNVWRSPLKHILQRGVKEMWWCSGGLCPEAEGPAPWGGLAPSLLPCWAAAKPGAHSASPAPAAPGAGAGTLHTALPALPDCVGDTLHADAVGELPHSLPFACVPDPAALLQGGRRSARHPRVPGLRSLPAPLTLLAGCLALPLPPPPPCLPRQHAGPAPAASGQNRSLPPTLATSKKTEGLPVLSFPREQLISD